MDFYFADMYPNMGVINTGIQTIPEAADKAVIEEDVKEQTSATVTPKSKKNMLIGIIAIIVLMIVFGVIK